MTKEEIRRLTLTEILAELLASVRDMAERIKEPEIDRESLAERLLRDLDEWRLLAEEMQDRTFAQLSEALAKRRPSNTHPDRYPIIRSARKRTVEPVGPGVIAEHRGRLLELAELRTLAEMMIENGQNFQEFAEALADRERVMIRETHVKASQGPQEGRSRDAGKLYPIVE